MDTSFVFRCSYSHFWEDISGSWKLLADIFNSFLRRVGLLLCVISGYVSNCYAPHPFETVISHRRKLFPFSLLSFWFELVLFMLLFQCHPYLLYHVNFVWFIQDISRKKKRLPFLFWLFSVIIPLLLTAIAVRGHSSTKLSIFVIILTEELRFAQESSRWDSVSLA